MERSLLQGEIHGEIPGECNDGPEYCQSYDEDYKIFQGIGLLNFGHKKYKCDLLLKYLFTCSKELKIRE